MKKIRCTRPAIIELSETIAKLVFRVVGEELGKKIIPAGFKACCDMTFLRNEGNMPVVIVGSGCAGIAHKKNKYIDIESLYKAYRIFRNIFIEWLYRK